MGQITLEQRYEIAALYNAGKTLAYIGYTLGFNKSSISRELRRNCDKRSGIYRASLADKKCKQHHLSKSKKIYLTPEVITLIERLIREDYSPEQVSGYCKKLVLTV